MYINGYENLSHPNSVYCYIHSSVASYKEMKAFFGGPEYCLSFDSGHIYSLEQLNGEFVHSSIVSYASIPNHIQIDLNKQILISKFVAAGLKEKYSCLFFGKNHSILPAKHISLIGPPYINFGFSIQILSIQGKEFFLIDPKMIITKDGETWDDEFAHANYTTLNKYPMQYSQFLKIIKTAEDILGSEFSIDLSDGKYSYKLATQIKQNEIKVTGHEPRISFGTGKPDTFPASGIKKYGPRDYNLSTPRPKNIKIGIISERDSFPLLTRVRKGETDKKNPFPGFRIVYKTDLIGSKDWIARLTEAELLNCKTEEELTVLFREKIHQIKVNCDVYVIELPTATRMQIAEIDLRDLLKVLFWKERKASQIILRTTEEKCTNLVVDNLALGIYVSAGGQPWILEEPCDDQVFIGISFGKTKNNRTLIGTVEIFDSYGVSLGMAVSEIKTLDREIRDRDLHLTNGQLEELIRNSIKRYIHDYKKEPLKLTIHKTSPFNSEELSTLGNVKDLSLEINLVYVCSKGKGLYLISEDSNPPKRLRYWVPEDDKAFLYTKGDNEWGTRFDPFIPKPMYIELQAKTSNSKYTIDNACLDVIKLTKLNWNSVASYERDPVTISHSRKITGLLRGGLTLDDAPRDVKYFI